MHRLPGVREVTRVGDQLSIEGDRRAIAHVGSWLVSTGRVPDDLRVDVPDLESALLTLLDQPTETDRKIGAA